MTAHTTALVADAQQEVGHSEFLVCVDEVEHLRREGVHTHADGEAVRRLLGPAGKIAVGSDLRDPEVDGGLAIGHGDGGRGLLRDVLAEKGAVVDRREDVAVHHEERFGGTIDEREPARRAQRPPFANVIDGDVPALAVSEVGFNKVREVAGADRHPVEALPSQLADDDLEDWVLPDGDERFGEHGRVGLQPGSFAAGKDDGSHRRRLRRCTGRRGTGTDRHRGTMRESA